jgi:uncharacterized protein YndB with AHSA1/START domain
MAGNEIVIEAAPSDVFDVLVDPQAYIDWVVGSKDIRDVDEGWPTPGTRFHHTLGAGPFTLKDTTKVLRFERPSLLELEVRFRPAGVGVVRLDLEPAYSGRCTRVRLTETFERGAAARWWSPGLDQLTRIRNAWSLRRLRRIVLEREGRLQLTGRRDQGPLPRA